MQLKPLTWSLILIVVGLCAWSPWITRDIASQLAETQFNAVWNSIIDGCGTSGRNLGAKDFRKVPFWRVRSIGLSMWIGHARRACTPYNSLCIVCGNCIWVSEALATRQNPNFFSDIISEISSHGDIFMPLSPSAQKIQDLLNTLGYNYTVIEHTESTRTAQEAAERAGCELGQIVKSLVFKGNDSGKPILVLTSGANRVDEKRIHEYAGESISRANADFVRAATGFAIGGVPPVGHTQAMETYIDEDFLQYQTIWSAAGTPNAIFELKTEDLQTMTNGKIVRVK